jgi:hypothetical protein
MKEYYYKIIEGSVIDYNKFGKKLTDTDFSGIYLQCTQEDALRYLEHKANSSVENKLILVRFSIENDYYFIENELVGNPNIKYEDKVQIIKNELSSKYNLNIKDKLIDSLDKPIKVLEITSESIYELIVPHKLVNEVILENPTILEHYDVLTMKNCNINYKYAILSK